MLLQSHNTYASEVMSKDFTIVKDNINLDKILSILIKDKKEEIFIVDNFDRLIGIITLKDLYKIYDSDDSMDHFEKFI